MQDLTEHAEQRRDRLTLVRDVGVLQVKLLVDGFRDLLLVPASLVAGLLSFISGKRRGNDPFYSLLRLGRRSEHWINLFGAADRHAASRPGDGPDIDVVVARVEAFVVEEYQSGRLTGKARERLEQAVERLRRAAERRRGDQSR